MPASPTPGPRNNPSLRPLVSGVGPEPATPAQVARRFADLIVGGARLRPAGCARRDPERLLQRYRPRHEIRLFDTTYFLGDQRYNEALGFFVGFVVRREPDGRPARAIHPRIFYKDSSLVWRVASHFVHDEDEYWIGKGDVRWVRSAGEEWLTSAEETTNLPFEVQHAFDLASRARKRIRDHDAVELLLREGPSGRIAPYADFVSPRRRAAARSRIHGGRPVARFTRQGDPTSLRFASGFEPDFADGLIEEARSFSKFFGGRLRKLRILSRNRRIQYLFMASPTHVWINPPQTLTTELSSYGVRVDDVLVDEDLCVPGYEYHEPDEDSQIPAGYAGAPHPKDPHRADASAWIEALPVIQEFRARVLGGDRRARR